VRFALLKASLRVEGQNGQQQKYFGFTGGASSCGLKAGDSFDGRKRRRQNEVMTGLSEWFQEHSIPVKLLDLDTENKARGSLTHFFGGQVPKVNIHTPAGLDAFVDELTHGPPVIRHRRNRKRQLPPSMF
jgi:hypothetical protein